MRGSVLSLLRNPTEKGREVKEEENIALRCDGCYKKNVEIQISFKAPTLLRIVASELTIKESSCRQFTLNVPSNQYFITKVNLNIFWRYLANNLPAT